MLICFSLQNFKSFDDEAELSMISAQNVRDNQEHVARVSSVEILKHAVIYGANASGKSNWIEAVRFFQNVVKDKIPVQAADMFCKKRKNNRTRGTRFEIQFSVQNKFFAYGFSAVLAEQKIHEEWLYELHVDGESSCIYERMKTGRVELSEEFLSQLNDDEKKRLQVYKDDFQEMEDMLFLTFMNQNKKYVCNSSLMVFQQVSNWILQNIFVISPNGIFSDLAYYHDAASLKRVNRLIRSFDTGISKIEIKESSYTEMKGILPEGIYRHFKEQVDKKRREKRAFRLTMRSKDAFFSVSADGTDAFVVSTLRLRHENSDFDFWFNEESDGTRRLFDLLDMILKRENDVVYIVDELERSLHPKLTEHFLRLFMKENGAGEKQLIFSTHEASIMNQKLFRRDEIWFVERSLAHASRLYSLNRFRNRYDKMLPKAYLEGRYGAIPVLSSFGYGEDE